VRVKLIAIYFLYSIDKLSRREGRNRYVTEPLRLGFGGVEHSVSALLHRDLKLSLKGFCYWVVLVAIKMNLSGLLPRKLILRKSLLLRFRCNSDKPQRLVESSSRGDTVQLRTMMIPRGVVKPQRHSLLLLRGVGGSFGGK